MIEIDILAIYKVYAILGGLLYLISWVLLSLFGKQVEYGYTWAYPTINEVKITINYFVKAVCVCRIIIIINIGKYNNVR
jgi:hypothetical protein